MMSTAGDLVNILRRIIDAWDSLPAGNYSPERIEYWLEKKMSPAIISARKDLQRLTSQTSRLSSEPSLDDKIVDGIHQEILSEMNELKKSSGP